MPVINQPPKYDVIKKYLDYLKSLINDYELDYIVCHADEDIYAKLAHCIWNHGHLYEKICLFMGGFHQLRVHQRLIYKRHAVMGYRDLFVDAGVIAERSVDKNI